MQYGTEVYPYHRIKKVTQEEKRKSIDVLSLGYLGAYFLCSFLVSRAVLINIIPNFAPLAPFGIAAVIAVSIRKEEKFSAASGFGALLGYVTLYSEVNNIEVYIIACAFVIAINAATRKASESTRLLLNFSGVTSICMIIEYFLEGIGIERSIIFTFLAVSLCAAVYYMLSYFISCSELFKTDHIYKSEELISMIAGISFIIAGLRQISFLKISVCNVFAFTFVLMTGYIEGSAVGGASGIAAGMIIGMGTPYMMLYTALCGLCGTICGVFNKKGKVIAGISYLMTFIIVKMYSRGYGNFVIMEGVISFIIFLAVREKFYFKVAKEFNAEKKEVYLEGNYSEKFKNLFLGRLNNFSDLLYNMSETLNGLVENEKLTMKNKGSALIDSLAERVCSNCSMNKLCWKREIYSTYGNFLELIENYQNRKFRIPAELEKKCVKRTALMKNTEDIVNNFIISEMWRNRLSEGRELLSKEISNMGNSVKEIVDEFNTSIRIDENAEGKIYDLLSKKRIDFSDVVCICNKHGRYNVRITMSACEENQKCVKEVLPVLNQALKRTMCVRDDGCNINIESGKCTVNFEETPKYHIATYTAKKSRDGEKFSGDSFAYSKLKDGTYIITLSDGMGFGPSAESESSAAVSLINKFTEAGFSKVTAVNTVNSIMAFKFASDEKYSTIDISSIDLYTGETSFMKVGAVSSFIIRKNGIEKISSKSLPIGVLDDVDADISEKKLQDGDIIVMVSDGIFDHSSKDLGKSEWLEKYLQTEKQVLPEELANNIIKKSIEISNGKVRDDMTVIVSKVYSIY